MMSSTKMVCGVAFAAALLAGNAGAAPSIPEDSSAVARIDRARDEGRIDAATHALLGMRLVRSPKTLPEEFRPFEGEPSLRCGTLLTRRAFVLAKAGVFNEAQAVEYAVLGGRPSLPNSILVYDGAAALIGTVHYNVANVPTVDAQQIADYLTYSWDTEFGTMGWRVPPPDVGGGGADPDALLDLYLDPTLGFAYTQPIQEDTCANVWACTASYIVLDPQVPNVETYVAHELNHASQFAYDYSDGDFIYEATATWMEDKVYDLVNDYEFFVADFQAVPQRTLSFANSSPSNTYMYGGAIFLHYIADLYDSGGTTAVRDVWDALKANNRDWYDGADTVLSPEGFTDIQDIYREFAGVRLLTGIRDDGTLEEGDNMTSLTLENAYDFSSLDGGSSTSPPEGMGANYILVTSAGSQEGDELTLHISSDEPGPWAITAVLMPATGSASFTVFVDDDDDGSVEATIPDIYVYNEIGFAITNTSNASDGVDSSFGSGVDRTPHPFSWNFGGGGDDAVGCGCTIPAGRRSPSTVSVIAAFLVAAFSIVVRRR